MDELSRKSIERTQARREHRKMAKKRVKAIPDVDLDVIEVVIVCKVIMNELDLQNLFTDSREAMERFSDKHGETTCFINMPECKLALHED